MYIADEGDENGGGEESDAGDGAQALNDGMLCGERFYLPFDIFDASFEVNDFGACFAEGRAQGERNGAFGIFDQSLESRDDVMRALEDGDSDLAQDAACGVDAGGTVSDVGGTVAVQSGQNMLIEGFDGDRMDILVPECFEESFGVGAIGLVAHGVRAGDVRWEQDYGMAEALELAGSSVGGAARLEENC